jgi:RNA polymerase sigma-70 factor, ECF subfamily
LEASAGFSRAGHDDVHVADSPTFLLTVDPDRVDRLRPEPIDRIIAGDEAAFTALFREYHPALCSFVYARVRSAAVAEELVMDVFLWLWRNHARLRLTGTLRSYLFAAAEHAAADHLRRRRLEANLASDVDAKVRPLPGMATLRGTPADDTERAELALAIARAADVLPDRCRAVFLLWQQHLAYAEIAQALGVSVKTVETQLSRAVSVLRSRLRAFRK